MLVVFESGCVFQQAQEHVLADVFRVVRGLRLVEGQAVDGASPGAHGALHEVVLPERWLHTGYRLLATNTKPASEMCPE